MVEEIPTLRKKHGRVGDCIAGLAARAPGAMLGAILD